MKKSFICFAAILAIFVGIFVVSCSSSADSPAPVIFTQPGGGGTQTDSGGGTEPTPTTPTPPAEYNVTYIITNGSDDMTGELRTSGKYTVQSELTIPQKEGFVFKGWYSDQDQTQAVTSFAGLTGDVVLYGHWAGTIYTVVIEGIDGGSRSSPMISGYKDEWVWRHSDTFSGQYTIRARLGFSTEDTTIELPTYGKKYYNFKGLYLDSEFNGTAVTQIDKSSAAPGSTLTLYIKWTEKVYKFNYDLLFDNGVTNPNENFEITVSSEPKILKEPTHIDSNYKFGGWYVRDSNLSQEFSGWYHYCVTEVKIERKLYTQYYNFINGAEEGDEINLTLHAKWKRATPNTPSGATVLVASMGTMANWRCNGSQENYFLITDASGTSQELESFMDMLSASSHNSLNNSCCYLDFSSLSDCSFLDYADFSVRKLNVHISGVKWPSNPNLTSMPIFAGSKYLRTIDIPDGVTSIGPGVFEECAALESVEIPNSVTSIGANAFCECSSLTKLNIPNSVKNIGSYAFTGCKSLTELTIPFVGSSADATSATDETKFSYVAGSGSYHRPNLTSLKKVNVTDGKLFAEAFKGWSKIESITLPSGLTGIPHSAFYGCSSLKNINIPSGVTSIGYYAFRGCSSLESVNIPSGVKAISQQLFSGCSSLKSIDIPSGVTVIYSGAFEGCAALTSIEIPTVVTDIRESAFKGCSLIASMNIPSGVEKINKSTFEGCASLASIEIPSGVTEIGASAFKGCASLARVNIPSGVNEIMESTFEGCSSLENIQIPNDSNIAKVGNLAFCGCSALKTINLPSEVKAIFNYAFKDCESLRSITVPSSIGVSAFEGCSSLYSVSITDKEYEYNGYPKYFELQTYENGSWSYYQGADHGIIGLRAFKNCSKLTSITIPETVDEICPYAFDGAGLTSVIAKRALYLVDDDYYEESIDIYGNKYYIHGGSGTYSFEAEQRRENANALAKDYVDKRFASLDLTK